MCLRTSSIFTVHKHFWHDYSSIHHKSGKILLPVHAFVATAAANTEAITVRPMTTSFNIPGTVMLLTVIVAFLRLRTDDINAYSRLVARAEGFPQPF